MKWYWWVVIALAVGVAGWWFLREEKEEEEKMERVRAGKALKKVLSNLTSNDDGIVRTESEKIDPAGNQ